MRLHKISIAAVVLALFGLMAIPNNAQAQQQQGQATFGNLVAALNNINAQVRALEQADINVENIQVARVRDIRDNLNDNQVETLNNAFRDANIEVLREGIQDNEVLNNFLNENDIAVNDVVAVNVLSGGDVVVFVDEEGVLG